MKKKPTTDPYCLTDAPGEKARVALFGPAVGCQRVGGGKHGLGRGFFGLLRDSGLLCLSVNGLFKPLAPAVVSHKGPQLEPVTHRQTDGLCGCRFFFHAASITQRVPHATKYFSHKILATRDTAVL